MSSDLLQLDKPEVEDDDDNEDDDSDDDDKDDDEAEGMSSCFLFHFKLCTFHLSNLLDVGIDHISLRPIISFS